jgi:hypothetical protein
VPPQDRGLLARLDALVELAADRHGSPWPLASPPPPGADASGPAACGSALALRDAVELLRAVGEGVGLLRVRGDRLEATSLRHAWAQIDPGLRAGLVYAAWCQQATLIGCLAELVAAAGEDHRRAHPRELAGRFFPHAAVGAGDQGEAPGQVSLEWTVSHGVLPRAAATPA